MLKKPSDFLQRQQAVDPLRSIICEAPAGSGKTELLTQRYLTLLARVNKPEEILAITFTRKAAGEMRSRVVEALHLGLQSESPTSEHKKLTWQLARKVIDRHNALSWQLIDNPNRLQILTFDSLCAKLASTLPLHSSFASSPPIANQAEELYALAARALLETLEGDVPWANAIALLLRRLDNDVQMLERLFVSMLAGREGWLPLIGSGIAGLESSQDGHSGIQSHAHNDYLIATLEENLQAVRQDTINKIKQRIPAGLHRSIIEFAAFAANNLQRIGGESPLLQCLNLDLDGGVLPGSEENGMKCWQGIIVMLTGTTGKWRKSLDKRVGFPPGDNASEKKIFKEKKSQCLALIESLQHQAGIDELFDDLRTLPNAHYDSDQLQLMSALQALLPVLSAHLTLAFREKNAVDFSEISIKARMAMGAAAVDSELAMKLDYQIQHILVDEFQDTSPAQIELLTQLTTGWTPGDGRTLFCVGDAMQSIYGFRGANVGLFIHCINHGLGHIPLTPIRLTTNFRSQAGLVDWINTVFDGAFPPHNDVSDGAVRYSKSEAFNDGIDQSSVAVHGFSEGTDKSDEAKTVLEIVSETRRQYPQESIAILVRNRSHAERIAPTLKNAGFSFRAVDLEHLQEHMPVQDLMALTHALLRPSDRIAWLAVLRAPWCGLSVCDLHCVANACFTAASVADLGLSRSTLQPTVLEQMSLCLDVSPSAPPKPPHSVLQADSGQVDLFAEPPQHNSPYAPALLSQDGAQRLQRVTRLLQQAIQQQQRKSLRQWVEGTWIALGGPACLQQPADIKNTQLFFELLETLDVNTVLEKRNSLEVAVKKLFAMADPDSDEKIQIMTIHKSKGLEFDHVIVPGLEHPSRAPDKDLLKWYERLSEDGHNQLIIAPISAKGKYQNSASASASATKTKSVDATFAHVSAHEKKKERYELCRLLYVACTRAKSRLYLMAQIKPDSKDESLHATPTKGSLLSVIWQPVVSKIIVHKKESDAAEGDIPTSKYSQNESDGALVEALEKEGSTVTYDRAAIDQARPIRRLNSSWCLPSLPEGKLLDPYVPYYQHKNPLDLVDPSTSAVLGSQTPRHVGTLTHRLLQDIGEKGIDVWQQRDLENSADFWRNRLMTMGVPLSELNAAVQQVKCSIAMVLQDKNNAWIFSENNISLRHEYPITVKKGNSANNFIIDLLVETSDATWVIDFKTSQPADQETQECFLEREKSLYQENMRNYKTGIKEMGYSQVKCALYFPLLSALTVYEEN